MTLNYNQCCNQPTNQTNKQLPNYSAPQDYFGTYWTFWNMEICNYAPLCNHNTSLEVSKYLLTKQSTKVCTYFHPKQNSRNVHLFAPLTEQLTDFRMFVHQIVLEFSVPCTVHPVQCTLYSATCTVLPVQLTLYSAPCTEYTTQCKYTSQWCTTALQLLLMCIAVHCNKIV